MGEQNKTDRLRPCPMCGCAATFVKHSAGVPGTQGFDKWDAVACKHCRTTVGACDRRFRCREDAATAWNRRVAAAPKVEPAEAANWKFNALYDDTEVRSAADDKLLAVICKSSEQRRIVRLLKGALAAQQAPAQPPAKVEPAEQATNWQEPHPPSRHCMCPSCIPSFDDQFAAQQAPAQPLEKWIFDPHDIEQGMMLNPAWLKANGLTAQEAAAQPPAKVEREALTGWQDIATAPKDGTALLCFWQNEWAPTIQHYGLAMFIRGEWCSVDDEDMRFGDPTHWMPLPPAPTVGEKENGNG